MSAPVLAHTNFKAPFIQETDASNYATGAALQQVEGNGLENPVSFTSQKMQLEETN